MAQFQLSLIVIVALGICSATVIYAVFLRGEWWYLAMVRMCVFSAFFFLALLLLLFRLLILCVVGLSRGRSGFVSRLVFLSKALYHACFICEQRCRWWSRRPKLTSLVILNIKPLIKFTVYIYSSRLESTATKVHYFPP